MLPRVREFVLPLMALALLATLGGCRNPVEQVVEEQQGLKTIAVLYGNFSGMNRGQPPASAEQLKQFAQALKQRGQVPMGLEIEDVEAVFVSPRDNQPYALMFDNQGPATGMYGDRVIAYEQSGRDGMRQIAFSNTQVIDANEEEFAKYVPNAK